MSGVLGMHQLNMNGFERFQNLLNILSYWSCSLKFIFCYGIPEKVMEINPALPLPHMLVVGLLKNENLNLI